MKIRISSAQAEPINKDPIKAIKENSELKQIEGQYDKLSLYTTREGDIIVCDAQDILIPKGYRKDIISELHSTHLFDTSMINLAKGKCYWPSMEEELKNTSSPKRSSTSTSWKLTR